MSLGKKLRSAGNTFRRELQVYRLVLANPRTPKIAKVLLALAIGYALLPLDLIPDFIPVLGHLDDAIIIPAFVILALRLIPAEVVDDCRRRVSETAKS